MSHMLYIDAVVLFLFVTAWYLVSLVIRRIDIADILWGAGFIVIVLTSLVIIETISLRALVMGGLVIVWGSRLATRIYFKNKGKPEDFRYHQWREQWGGSFVLRSYFQVFLLQGVLMFVVLAPVLYVIGGKHSGPLAILDYIGLAGWLVGFMIETVADYQLDAFKQKSYNRGKILQSGLWKYSRHPNYFGEVVMWWSIYCMALAVPGGLYTIIGPLAITFLILKVSGIPLLEDHYRDNPQFQLYKERTSVFIPLPPRTKTK